MYSNSSHTNKEEFSSVQVRGQHQVSLWLRFKLLSHKVAALQKSLSRCIYFLLNLKRQLVLIYSNNGIIEI